MMLFTFARGSSPRLARSLRLRLRRVSFALLIGSVLLLCPSCSRQGAKSAADTPQGLREAAKESNDPAVLGRWLLIELLAPNGSAEQARAAADWLERYFAEYDDQRNAAYDDQRPAAQQVAA